ncbi:hypothetical protein HPB50_029047 [Hyalomma asiaticum]|nr:hypothetical protein HPB50_029047 [Hyalomma asiaticum]
MLYSPERASRIIYACAALHNIALDSGGRTLDELGGGVPPPEQPEEPGGGQALQPCDVLLRGHGLQLPHHRILGCCRPLLRRCPSARRHNEATRRLFDSSKSLQ